LATGDVRGVAWLVRAMADDGGVGGGPGLAPSIEETAVTVEALAGFLCGEDGTAELRRQAAGAVEQGIHWLLSRTAGGRTFPTAPIGLYFAKLWYAEDLYPVVFTVAALERAAAISASP
jgi:squalene-hopene/tetraprenyl-beta-curcumene cyclase